MNEPRDELFAPVLAVIGAIFVVAGLLLTRVHILVLFGILLAIFGVLALAQAIGVALGHGHLPGMSSDARKRREHDE